MPHSNIDLKTQTRARRLRRELNKAEAAMWSILRDLRPFGARFRRETPNGAYIADFAWLSACIVIEVDGDSHEADHGRKRDRRRDAFMRGTGFTALRSDNLQVLDKPDYVFVTIEDHMSPSPKKGVSP
jgi:very-short-patch-repair endonuclease